MLCLKFFFGLKIFKPVSFLFSFVSDSLSYSERDKGKRKWNWLKIFKHNVHDKSANIHQSGYFFLSVNGTIVAVTCIMRFLEYKRFAMGKKEWFCLYWKKKHFRSVLRNKICFRNVFEKHEYLVLSTELIR